MGNFFQSIIKALPLQTILGWIFPQIGAALTAYEADKSPDNALLLADSVLNAAAQQFDAPLLPKLQAVESTLSPLLDSGIAFEQAPSLETAKPFASALLVTIQVFVPNLPTTEAAQWLDDTAVLLSKYGVK